MRSAAIRLTSDCYFLHNSTELSGQSLLIVRLPSSSCSSRCLPSPASPSGATVHPFTSLSPSTTVHHHLLPLTDTTRNSSRRTTAFGTSLHSSPSVISQLERGVPHPSPDPSSQIHDLFHSLAISRSSFGISFRFSFFPISIPTLYL